MAGHLDKAKKPTQKRVPAKGSKSTTKRPMPGRDKGGKRFPDLSGDGKLTMKDILIGKGVIKKSKGGRAMPAHKKKKKKMMKKRTMKRGGGMMKPKMMGGGNVMKKRMKRGGKVN
jgi:hypothetical protein|tara:strand:+ start:327 stop:671 length:345 start_codon:yes stop_codon:yes gene_type:complete